jgi:hypothetical protein
MPLMRAHRGWRRTQQRGHSGEQQLLTHMVVVCWITVFLSTWLHS